MGEAARRAIVETKRRAGVEAAFHHARAFVAATVPELHRVTGRAPRRWRWRHGINWTKAAYLNAAAAIFASLAHTRDPPVIRKNDEGR